jgi:hypothetical protein
MKKFIVGFFWYLNNKSFSKCWVRGHFVVFGCHGRRPGAGGRRRIISPIMAHLTIASECSGQAFVVAGQPSAAHQPGKGAFDDPAPGQHLEGVLAGRLAPDLHPDVQVARGEGDQLAGVAPSAQTSTIEGIAIRARSSTRRPPSRSCRAAVLTSTTTSIPRVSVTMWRLRPLIFLPVA